MPPLVALQPINGCDAKKQGGNCETRLKLAAK